MELFPAWFCLRFLRDEGKRVVAVSLDSNAVTEADDFCRAFARGWSLPRRTSAITVRGNVLYFTCGGDSCALPIPAAAVEEFKDFYYHQPSLRFWLENAFVPRAVIARFNVAAEIKANRYPGEWQTIEPVYAL